MCDITQIHIQQGDKVRAIDNLCFSGVNSCVGTSEKIQLQGVDEVACLNAETRKFSLIVVFDDVEQRPRCFRLVTMPFGAISSVHVFLRTASAMNHLRISCVRHP